MERKEDKNAYPLLEKTETYGEPKEGERDVYAHKIEYLLSLFGYSVGFGNVWRFPYICMTSGGGAFLIPFFFFLFVCGLPLYYLEVSLGQFSGKSPLVVWSISPLFRGLGLLMVTISLILTWYYNMIIGWVLYYLVHSFFPKIPWASCDNWWNTDSCIVSRGDQINSTMGNSTLLANDSVTYSRDEYFNTSTDALATLNKTYTTAAMEFWRYNVIRASGGIDNPGSLQWHLVVCLLVAWVFTLLCLIKGVKSMGKVVYVTVLLPYILLTVLLIRGLTLPGATDGIIYYLKPDFSYLLQIQVWVRAAVQVFFSLGPCWGGLITMSSHIKFKNNCLRDALAGTLADGLTSFYAGFVVFTIIGSMAYDVGMTVPEVANAGPGLVFVTYPEALQRLPFPHIWAILFFTMLLTVGVDSQFGQFETVSSGLCDAFPQYLNNRKALVTICLSIFFFVIGLPFTTHAGEYLLQLVDWYAAALCIFFGGALECIIIGWIYGAERFSRDIQLMVGRPVHIIVRICWCIITPGILLATLLVTVSNYGEPSHESYTYPGYAIAIGWIIALLSTMMVPFGMIYQFIRSKGTFRQILGRLIQPNDNWGPNDKEENQKYSMFQYGDNLAQSIKLNITGK